MRLVEIGQIKPRLHVQRWRKGMPEDREAILEKVAEAFQVYVSSDGIPIPARVNISTARSG